MDGAKLRVLLVEDDEDSRELLALYLRSRGLEVTTAESCERATGVLEGFTPDVAVLDLTLPDGDGVELGRALRQQLAALRLVALSGHVGRDHADRTQQAGFDVYLEKPVDPSAVISAIIERAS